jgi:DNA repair exonuclease SbcCD ATPase subunit
VRIAHAADIHIRGLARHDEYRELLDSFIDDVAAQRPDVLLIAGDTFHSKISGLTPEYIELFSRFVRKLSVALPLTYITLGNHDGNLSNVQRLDSVSPIMEAVGAANVICCRKSGTYAMPCNAALAVYSLFDVDGWSSITPAPGKLNIATYHGSVTGAVSDTGWTVDSGDVTLDRFTGFDLLLLGDIHKRQVFERSGAPWGAYPGSLIQQNFGEDAAKGYLIWDVCAGSQPRVTFRELLNRRPFITVTATDAAQLASFAPGTLPRVRVIVPRSNGVTADAISSDLRQRGITDVLVKFDDDQNGSTAIRGVSKTSRPSAQELLALAGDLGHTFSDDAAACVQLDAALRDATSQVAEPRRWSLRALRFDNVLSYGSGSFVSFDDVNGIVGLFGPNGVGKSSFVGALSYVLFNEADRDRARNALVINRQSDYCFGRAVIDVDGDAYAVERATLRTQRRDGSDASQTHLNVYRVIGEDQIDACGEQRSDTERVLRSLIGDPDACKVTSIATQGNVAKFIDDGPAPRRQALSRALGLSYLDDVHKLLSERTATKRLELRGLLQVDHDAEMARCTAVLSGSAATTLQLELRRGTLVDERHALEEESARTAAQRVMQRRRAELERSAVHLRTLLAAPVVHVRDRAEIAHDMDVAMEAMEAAHRCRAHADAVQHQRDDIGRKRRSMRILTEVPCGGAYASCQFIRDAAHVASTIAVDDAALAQLEARAPERSVGNHDVAALRAELKRADAARLITAERERNEGALRAVELELGSLSECDVRCDVDDRLKHAVTAIAVVDRELAAACREHDRATVVLDRTTVDRSRKLELLSEVGDMEKLVAAMSRRGVPLALLRQHLSEINERVSELLEQSAGLTARALIDGDELQIEVTSPRGTVPIELACGMEKFFTALAFRMVMAKLSPSSADFFVIDEGFGALDDSNVDAACRLLSIAKCMFSFVIIISHVDAIKDVADHILEIVRDEDGRSRIVQR